MNWNINLRKVPTMHHAEKKIQNIKQVMRLGGSNEKLQHMSNMSSKRQNKVRCNNLKK